MERTEVRAPVAREGSAPDRGERSERLARLAWALAAVWLLAWLTAVALVIANLSAIRTVGEADPVDLILPIGSAVIGTLLASRTPRDPTGWIFLSIAVIGALSGISTQYVFRSAHFTPLPFATWGRLDPRPLELARLPFGPRDLLLPDVPRRPAVIDRLAALGGDLRVSSEPGLGTTVVGTLPMSH
jgi:hypothetical protein